MVVELYSNVVISKYLSNIVAQVGHITFPLSPKYDQYIFVLLQAPPAQSIVVFELYCEYKCAWINAES